jgi:Bacterial regulatory proteins, luxR family
LRVLRYLPSNLSAPEIGRELYLSFHTVKTHMRSIYAKLGVHRAHRGGRARPRAGTPGAVLAASVTNANQGVRDGRWVEQRDQSIGKVSRQPAGLVPVSSCPHFSRSSLPVEVLAWLTCGTAGGDSHRS